MCYNPNLHVDHVDINAYTKFGQILLISSQDIEWKRNLNEILTSVKGCNSVTLCESMMPYVH